MRDRAADGPASRGGGGELVESYLEAVREQAKTVRGNQRTSRLQWNDGERVPAFWSLERDLEYDLLERDLATLERVAKKRTHAPARMQHLGEKQAMDKPEAIRNLHKRMMETKRAGGRTG